MAAPVSVSIVFAWNQLHLDQLPLKHTDHRDFISIRASNLSPPPPPPHLVLQNFFSS